MHSKTCQPLIIELSVFISITSDYWIRDLKETWKWRFWNQYLRHRNVNHYSCVINAISILMYNLCGDHIDNCNGSWKLTAQSQRISVFVSERTGVRFSRNTFFWLGILIRFTRWPRSFGGKWRQINTLEKRKIAYKEWRIIALSVKRTNAVVNFVEDFMTAVALVAV